MSNKMQQIYRMRTPAKTYLSALRQGSYGSTTPLTPLTSTSATHLLSSLHIHKTPEITLFSHNQLMIDLQSQNVRLMEKYLNFLEQRQKLRVHCNKGIEYSDIMDWDNTKQQLIKMKEILYDQDSNGYERNEKENKLATLKNNQQQIAKIKEQFSEYQHLFNQLKLILSSFDILPYTKQQIQNNSRIYPQLLRQDLNNILQQLSNIQSQIITGIKNQLTKINRLFGDNRDISQVDTDGPFSYELEQLIDTIQNIIRFKSKKDKEKEKDKEKAVYLSGNTSIDMMIQTQQKQKEKEKSNVSMFAKNKDKEGVNNGLFYMILSQAIGIQSLLEETESKEQM